MLSLIAAVGSNNVLGRGNDLIWHLPNDFKFFKDTTKGHPVIMGRKTYDSMGKPLPNRTNIIVTRQKGLSIEGCLIFNTLKEAIDKANALDDNPFIIGGAEIYKMAMPFVDRMLLTHVEFEEDGDAYFPEFNTNNWHEELIAEQAVDEKHQYPYRIKSYTRKN